MQTCTVLWLAITGPLKLQTFLKIKTAQEAQRVSNRLLHIQSQGAQTQVHLYCITRSTYSFCRGTKTSHSSFQHTSYASHGAEEWENGNTEAGHKEHFHFQTWPFQRWDQEVKTLLRNLQWEWTSLSNQWVYKVLENSFLLHVHPTIPEF